MHLRRNRHQGQQQQTEHAAEHHNEPRFEQPVVVKKEEPVFNWDRITLPREVREIAAMRKKLHKKITEIENRLRFGYSEPLYDYKMELVKQDVELCCKMTDALLK